MTRTSFKSTKELVGCYIAAEYNNFSNIYKVVDCTPKMIELRECDWDGVFENDDPTYKTCHIKFDDDKAVLVGKLFKKRVDFDEEGFVILKDFAWNGCGHVFVVALNDKEAKKYEFSQYWG